MTGGVASTVTYPDSEDAVSVAWFTAVQWSCTTCRWCSLTETEIWSLTGRNWSWMSGVPISTSIRSMK